MKYKILVVDDERPILKMLKDYLEMENYEVYVFENGKDVINKVQEIIPDLVILDINMPQIDGFEVCKQIREKIKCPIIFLTARIFENDLIMGFNIGADDYVKKPFSLKELNVRIKAHLRREERTNPNIKRKKGLHIDYLKHTAFYDDKEILFSKTEFEIIKLLSLNEGQVFDKENIYEKVRGFDGIGNSDVIKEHIRRIRNKFAEFTNKEYIETLWGVGYKWKS